MRIAYFVAITLVALAAAAPASSQTCEDQYKACVARGHKGAECRKSTNSCLNSGRWIGPAGHEYPITKKK